MQEIDISKLHSCFSLQLARAKRNVASSYPRSCPLEGARLCTYLRWFFRPAHNQIGLLRSILPRKALVRFFRFRTGCHALPNAAGA